VDPHTFERVFKAFCDPTRMQVLLMLQQRPYCATELLSEVSVGQSTLSHHMQILVNSGVVSAERQGKRTVYRISAEGLDQCSALIEAFKAGVQEQDYVPQERPVEERPARKPRAKKEPEEKPRRRDAIWLL